MYMYVGLFDITKLTCVFDYLRLYLDLYVRLVCKIIFFIYNYLSRMKIGNYSFSRNIYQ
jgi:hypothetical protein